MISLREFDPTMSPPRKIDNVEAVIYLIRGQRVMLDSDLAEIYGARSGALSSAEPPKKREIGFHVRERSVRYRAKKRF